ncbi:methylated-DNA--[protein]-cysteine S-methyltransferase [Halomonas halocynthiae]|uniref:methylated-DNA--[protein]-cysteine S-methyltransferase n=1 Tax=Halomonas halocynthiae TaxID=176290 RepID=UPI000429722B|nr:methylated-DNA--[protein]-cysteine S-methyltransferase [Halomonas halocynthiae]
MTTDAFDYFCPPPGTVRGLILIRANQSALTRVDFINEAAAHHAPQPNTLTQSASHQLAEYFSGQRQHFDLPLAPAGTDFQRRVWQALTEISFGETCSYGELAGRVGSKGGQRAVGAANGKNPISVIIPCHRVIGSNGKLTGYAGGIDRKQWLLSFEADEMPFELD